MSSERHTSRPSPGDASFQVAINQERTQPLTRVRLSPGTIRYMYDRSSDSKANGEPGQDYLIFCYTSHRMAFAVCDGVGGSFLGNLAAHFLGAHLVKWLWEHPSLVTREQIQRDLSQHLRELVGPASHLIENYPLPHGLQPIVREVLEEKRAYGSEAMFVCGRIEWSAERSSSQVVLAWLGDAELQVCDRSGRWHRLHGTVAERWSTIRGPRGNLQVLIAPVDDIARIIGYSDGLRSLADYLRHLPDSVLDHALKRLGQDPRSDDLSLVDIALDEQHMPPEIVPLGEARTAGATAPESHRPTADIPTSEWPKRAEPSPAPDPSSTLLPAPKFLSPPYNAIINPGLELIWTAVPGAEVYVVQEATNPEFDRKDVVSECVDQPYFTVEEDKPGVYYYRVQAKTSRALSAWSNPWRVQIQKIEADRTR